MSCADRLSRIRIQGLEGGEVMGKIFDWVMRAISTLLGLAMVLLGGVWILQGFDLAFRVGFMVGDKQWALYGAILALVGVAQIVWSNTRRRYEKDDKSPMS
jgi:hypothetical protein